MTVLLFICFIVCYLIINLTLALIIDKTALGKFSLGYDSMQQ